MSNQYKDRPVESGFRLPRIDNITASADGEMTLRTFDGDGWFLGVYRVLEAAL